jgi:hypothetical protein
LTDDAFIDWHAADDDTWYANMGEAFGLKQRKPR